MSSAAVTEAELAECQSVQRQMLRTDGQQQDQDRHRHAAMFTPVSVEELQGSYSGQSSWPRADAWSHAHSTDQALRRSHKEHMESFVVLQLWRRESSNIVMQVVFEKSCLPRAVRFSHAASTTGTFVQLVVMCEDDGHASRSSSANSTLASSFPQGEEDASNRQQGSTKAGEAAQRAGDSRRVSANDSGLQCTASKSRHACGEGYDGSQCTTASTARLSLALSQPPGMTGRSAQPDAQPSTASLLPGDQSSVGIGRYKFNRRSDASLRRSRLVIKTPIPEGIEPGISSPEDVSGQTSDSSSNGHQASQLSPP
ncbi:hypothetical protein V8C86DRAFT_2684165 [Haematococcus lacustris]